ncbi:MAG: plasmid mobilization protein [Eubacteriales bacterium]
MSKNLRRKIQVKTVRDVASLGQITNEELSADEKKYDKDNYNPLENIEEKGILIPDSRTEVITIRLTEKENEKIKKIAQENGISKSALVRMLVTRSLKKSDFF